MRIALSYAAVGAVWIAGSDYLLSRWRGRFSSVETLGSVKGLIFVLVTAILLYGVIRRLVGQQVVTAEKLKESQLRWQFALEGAGDGLWDRDVPAGQVFYSRQWKNILGYADDEISNTPGEWEALLHPDDRALASVGQAELDQGRRAIGEGGLEAWIEDTRRGWAEGEAGEA